MGVGALAAEPRDGALAEAGGRLDESIYIGLETLSVVVIGNDRACYALEVSTKLARGQCGTKWPFAHAPLVWLLEAPAWRCVFAKAARLLGAI